MALQCLHNEKHERFTCIAYANVGIPDDTHDKAWK